jgi:integrase/recombinase XerD
MHFETARTAFLEGYFSTHDRMPKTRAAYSSDLIQFERFLGKRFAFSAIQNTDIERWAADLRKKQFSPASIRRKLIVLKVFCHYWVRCGLLAQSPFLKVSVHVGRINQLPRTLSEPEVRLLLDHAQTIQDRIDLPGPAEYVARANRRGFLTVRNAALVELLFATGLRVSEISAIDLEDFAISEATIKVRGKGGRERMAFVVDSKSLDVQVKYLSMRRLRPSQSSAFFLNDRGNRLSAQGIGNVVHQLRKSCGIARVVTPHMLRHTVATFLLRNGTDIRLVQEFLGHASIVTTQRYTHVVKEHMIRELAIRHPSLVIRTRLT